LDKLRGDGEKGMASTQQRMENRKKPFVGWSYSTWFPFNLVKHTKNLRSSITEWKLSWEN